MSDWRSLLDRGDGWRGRSEPINITPVDIAILLSMKEHFCMQYSSFHQNIQSSFPGGSYDTIKIYISLCFIFMKVSRPREMW